MRHVFEIDRGPQAGAVRQEVHEAAVVGFEKLLEHQAGQELVLGELLRAETMAVGGQCALRHGVGRLQDTSG